jgi:hypothetical protein
MKMKSLAVFFGGLATLVLTLAAGAASAQQLKNVVGFDAGQLAGKTCRGGFDTGGGKRYSLGAVQVKFFSVNDDTLTATMRRSFGEEAYKNPHSDFLKKGLEDLGPVLELKVEGEKVSFSNSQGAKYILEYKKGFLEGNIDASQTKFKNEKLIPINLKCE